MPATTVTDPCGPTHFHGCPCHEARWQERLAAAEARAERAISDTVQEFGLRRAAEAEVARLREALSDVGRLLATSLKKPIDRIVDALRITQTVRAALAKGEERE